MKKKSIGKAALKNSVPAPPPAASLVMHGQVKEVTADTFRNLNHPKFPPPLPSLVELAARKFFPSVGEDAPDWAKRAAHLAFASAMPQSRKRNASEKYLAGFGSGELAGAAAWLPSEMTEATRAMMQIERDWAARLPSDQAADYFIGMRDGEKRMREMPEQATAARRVCVFRAIAARWPEVEKFKSSSALCEWLFSLADAGGKKTISSGKDNSREVRKVCKLIGLRYR